MCEERNSAGSSVSKRFYSLGEQINGTSYYYTNDHLGSIREVVDGSGAIHARYDYDSFGRQTKLSGYLDADFGFTGFYKEKTVGLDLTLFRAYDPDKGRWLSRDPIAIGTGPNLYAYVGNDPFDYMDLFGLESWHAPLWPPPDPRPTPTLCPTPNPNVMFGNLVNLLAAKLLLKQINDGKEENPYSEIFDAFLDQRLKKQADQIGELWALQTATPTFTITPTVSPTPTACHAPSK